MAASRWRWRASAARAANGSASPCDSGTGIDPANLAKLFSNFTQAEPVIASKYGGTGLGLALSQKLCHLMGGEITAESEPGLGSCFTVHIPVSPDGPAASLLEARGPDDGAAEIEGRALASKLAARDARFRGEGNGAPRPAEAPYRG
jgi:hypothetical protein